MLAPYIYTFISVIIVSLISFIGVLVLAMREEVLKRRIFFFISIAVGALLGDAFIHLIPEALEKFESPVTVGILTIVGIISFFILEKFLHWHHHGEDKENSHIHPMGQLVLFSDGIHNFMDGVIIGASFLVSVPVGVATSIAVILHEIPQEIGDFAVLLHSGYTKRRAFWLNFLSALSAILGALVLFTMEKIAQFSFAWFLPLAAGGFIYIAIADLIPELQKTKETKGSAVQISAVLAGILAMLALTLIE